MAQIEPLREHLSAAEREHIGKALLRTAGDVRAASGLLGLSERTLWRRLSALGIKPESYRAQTATAVP